MDSANSGSIQSSSGGDEEYDSRADSISALFHPTSSSSAAAAAAATLPPPPPSSSSSNHPNPSSFFDSFSFLDHSPLLPLDSSSPWPPRPIRPTPTPDFSPLASSFPRGPPIAHSSVQQPPDNSTAIAAPPRSSKKRSRASRRAPTTVLTTDTSNFRAMVQEFTGIPSPPFGAAGSPFSRSRFDLFHSSSPSSSSPSSLPPPYLLRPFPQKPPTFVSPNPSSSSTTITAIIDALASTTNTISNAKASTTIPITSAPTSISNSTPTNNNYQLPSSDPGLTSQSQSLFNLQSQGPVINFQSLLAQKYTLPTTVPPPFATRPQAVIPSAEFGSAELGLPPGLMIRSEGVQSGWAPASGPDGGEQARLRPVVGGNDNGAQQRVSSCKFKYSGPGSSEFNGEKGSEGVAARGEGMVDSWICSSD